MPELPILGLQYNSVVGGRESFVTTLSSGPFIGQDHWGVGDTVVLTNNSTRTGTVTFTETYQQDDTDGGITVFSNLGSAINLPTPGASTSLTPTDRGFGTYVLTSNSRFKRQLLTVKATLSAQPDGVLVESSYSVYVTPKVYQGSLYRQNGYSGERKVYSNYWAKCQPVNDVTKPLLLSNTGSVPLLIAVKDTAPTDTTIVGFVLNPGEFRIVTPLAAGYYYWAKVQYTGNSLDCEGQISYIQAG